MKSTLLLITILLNLSWALAQNKFSATLKDAETNESLIGVKVFVNGTQIGGSTDSEGKILLSNIPIGEQEITFSYIGYEQQKITYSFPVSENLVQTILLKPISDQLDEIILVSSRANRSIGRLPTRIEALTDEIDEAASMEPSRISHLITHTTGVQVQTTSAGSNGAVLRIQGLNGRYSKMLKDGFPLYGGFSGSLDVLQIPPLDLRQVEFVKGSSSTLHGGGAIAGVMNLISKNDDKEEVLLHFNHSTVGSNDLNAFISRKFGDFGFTNLVSYQLHSVYDADDDGFADLPELSKFNFNPKLFYHPNKKTNLYFGGTITREFREGGNVEAIDNKEFNAYNFYSDLQESNRYTTQFQLDKKIKNNQEIIIKNSFNFFDRYLNIREDTTGNRAIFGGRQNSSFSELTYNIEKTKHELIFGSNFITDNFIRKDLGEDGFTPIMEKHQTASLFMNHIWETADFLDLESGLRADWNQNESNISKDNGKLFIMPRIAVLLKYSPKITSRFGGGFGYRPLTIFNEEAEPYGFKNFLAIDYANIKPENSIGLNADISYKSSIGENMLITFNNMFFYNIIQNPIALQSIGNQLQFSNATNDIVSQGIETQMKFTFWKITWFLGYTFNNVYFNDSAKELLILTPKHSLKGDFLYVEDNKWRIGIDYEYKSGQRLSNGNITRDLFTTGILIERTLQNFVLFFNAENVTDTRQTRYESIVSGTNKTPQFTEIWAPLDGRFINFGVKLKLE